LREEEQRFDSRRTAMVPTIPNVAIETVASFIQKIKLSARFDFPV
jgi:hypothetical protein